MPNNESQSEVPQQDPKLQAAVELMGDPDEVVASMALDTIFKSKKRGEILANAQDNPDETVRRRAQQLSSMSMQEGLLEYTVEKYEQASLDILDGVINIDLLYDTSSSLLYLHKMVRNLSNGLKTERKTATMDEILRYMEEEEFYVPPLPWFDIETHLIGDVLSGEGAGTPIILSTLASAIGKRHGCELQPVLCNGFISLVKDNRICILENGWSARNIESNDEICVLNNQMLFRLYLSQLLTSSIATWEAYDTHLFLEIFQRILGLKDNPLPYPFGNSFPLDKQ